MRPATRPCAGALALALALAALGACSSGGASVFERMGAIASGVITAPAAEAPRELTRAELDRIPSATIALSRRGGSRTFLVPLAENNGRLNYRDAGGNAIVLYGNAVSGTASLGHDLQAVRFDPRDPIAHPTPLVQWPGRLNREYQYARRGLDGYSITLDCLLEAGARETIEIVERTYDVVRVSETCSDGVRQVANTYWVEDATGFVWRSEQWLGPELGSYTIEIIRPYAA